MTYEKKSLEQIAKRISTDRKYSKRIFTDYQFAQSEFLKVGVKIDTTTHKQMMQGYKSLTDSALKIFGRGRPVGFVIDPWRSS